MMKLTANRRHSKRTGLTGKEMEQEPDDEHRKHWKRHHTAALYLGLEISDVSLLAAYDTVTFINFRHGTPGRRKHILSLIGMEKRA